MVFTDLSYGYFLYEWAGLAGGPVLTDGKRHYFMHGSTIMKPGVFISVTKRVLRAISPFTAMRLLNQST